jgi:hypothetical protein
MLQDSGDSYCASANAGHHKFSFKIKEAVGMDCKTAPPNAQAACKHLQAA